MFQFRLTLSVARKPQRERGQRDICPIHSGESNAYNLVSSARLIGCAERRSQRRIRVHCLGLAVEGVFDGFDQTLAVHPGRALCYSALPG